MCCLYGFDYIKRIFLPGIPLNKYCLCEKIPVGPTLNSEWLFANIN